MRIGIVASTTEGCMRLQKNPSPMSGVDSLASGHNSQELILLRKNSIPAVSTVSARTRKGKCKTQNRAKNLSS